MSETKSFETIGDLRREGRALHAYCIDCGRERDLDLARIALGDALTVTEAGSRLRCRDCGGRKIFVTPAELETE